MRRNKSFLLKTPGKFTEEEKERLLKELRAPHPMVVWSGEPFRIQSIPPYNPKISNIINGSRPNKM